MIFITLLEAMECLYENLRRDEQLHFLKTLDVLYDAFGIDEKGNIEGSERERLQSL